MIEESARQIDLLLRQLRDGDYTSQQLDDWQTQVSDILLSWHEADVADFIERLPTEERQRVWQSVPSALIGSVLVEVSETLLPELVALTPTETMVIALQKMQKDDAASLIRQLPIGRATHLMRLAGLINDATVRASLAFRDDSVGALMDYQVVVADESDTVAAICARLRDLAVLPSHCDKLFITDQHKRLSGVLPLKRLLLSPSQRTAWEVMVKDNLHTFTSDDSVEDAASAFERYDLISAPVLDEQHKVLGRVTIEEIVDRMHSTSNLKLLNSAGIKGEEDLFAPVPYRFSNRWRWLLINLCAALVVSRVIGLFEETIVQMVALAVLMPIIAGMSGNVGNQTATLTVRALALDQIGVDNWRFILHKEILLSLLNGLVWGGLLAMFTYLLYQRLDLALLTAASMILCFFFGTVSGFTVPVLMQRLGKDPALGTTVVISVVTDTLSFFIFLGLGAIFLL